MRSTWAASRASRALAVAEARMTLVRRSRACECERSRRSRCERRDCNARRTHGAQTIGRSGCRRKGLPSKPKQTRRRLRVTFYTAGSQSAFAKRQSDGATERPCGWGKKKAEFWCFCFSVTFPTLPPFSLTWQFGHWQYPFDDARATRDMFAPRTAPLPGQAREGSP